MSNLRERGQNVHHTPPLRLDFKGLRIQTTGSIVISYPDLTLFYSLSLGRGRSGYEISSIDHLEVVLVLLVWVVSVRFFVGGRSSRPLDEGGTGLPGFPRIGPQFGLKIKEGGPPLDLPLARLIFNRVLKCDVIKKKFLKLWDLSGYSERTISKRPTCQKWAFRGKLSLRS